MNPTNEVVYCIQKYLWNPDKTTHIWTNAACTMLCIAYKSIFEILIKQHSFCFKATHYVVYCIQKYLWNPDKTTAAIYRLSSRVLCIAYKSIFEILIKQRWYHCLTTTLVVYCVQKYLWNPDKTTAFYWLARVLLLCIAYKSIFEILIKQPQIFVFCLPIVVYCIQKYLWNPDKTTSFFKICFVILLCIAYKSIFEILIKQPCTAYYRSFRGCVLHTKVSLKSW